MADAGRFHLEIVTPNRLFFSGEAEMVVVNAPDGFFGILAHHEPMVMVLEAGPMRIRQGGKELRLANSEGFIEVAADRVLIFADTAEWPEEIDANRALAAKQRAEERLRRQQSHIEYVRSKAAIARAMARLRVTGPR
jgi:F-type H+-transporting ATPase subunit epsilon